MRSIFVKSMIMFFILALGLASTPVLAGPVLDFQGIGSGTVTYYGPENCQLSDTGCTVVTEGNVKGKYIGNGTFTNTITVLWKAGFPNGSGGYCAPASGTETITAADGSTLTAKRVGILCEVGPTGTNGPYTFNGSYFITEGTKRFSGASGSGVQICSVDTDGNVLGFAHGTIKK
jgi:hypothetical protein